MRAPAPFEVELMAHLEAIPQARHQMGRWLGRSRVPKEIGEEMALVVTELVTNAVEASPGPTARIVVWMRLDPDEVVLRVSDQGGGFDHSVRSPPLPDPTTERGRGLPIVSALMDRVTVRRHHGCTEVEVTRRLPRRGTRSPAR